MKSRRNIAIHKNDKGFSAHWIDYCTKENLPYKLVNCFENNIIEQLKHVDVLLWHFSHVSFRDFLLAKNILFALEQTGIKVFPNFNTGWHFDDKVSQKYLLELIDAPLVPSYVFYDKKTALDWIEAVDFPIVFKLRGGAGSKNVKLIRTKKQAQRIVNKAFEKGFSSIDNWNYLKEMELFGNFSFHHLKEIIRGLKRGLFPKSNHLMFPRQKGYVYFQDFIPNNSFDVRVIVIDNKAFGIKRLVRENDFRASGSGIMLYDKDEIDIRCVSLAFEVAEKLKTQCLAFDFVFDKNNNPLIVEISYGFSSYAYGHCPGYWDRNLNWVEGKFNPEAWIIKSLIN